MDTSSHSLQSEVEVETTRFEKVFGENERSIRYRTVDSTRKNIVPTLTDSRVETSSVPTTSSLYASTSMHQRMTDLENNPYGFPAPFRFPFGHSSLLDNAHLDLPKEAVSSRTALDAEVIATTNGNGGRTSGYSTDHRPVDISKSCYRQADENIDLHQASRPPSRTIINPISTYLPTFEPQAYNHYGYPPCYPPYPYPPLMQPLFEENRKRFDDRLELQRPSADAPFRGSLPAQSQSRIDERYDNDRNYQRTREDEPYRTSFPAFSQMPYLEYPARDNCYERETRTCNILQRWKISFAGEPNEDVEEFLERLYDCRDCMRISEADILNMIPVLLTGPARYWARPIYRHWRSLREFEDALRMQYRIPNFNSRLDDEIRARTQAPDENIGSYLSCLRFLMDKMNPPMSYESQLDRAFNNLHPSYFYSIKRHQFRTFHELQVLGQQVEFCKERRKTYKPPPMTHNSLFSKIEPLNVEKSETTVIEAVEDEVDSSSIAALDTIGPPIHKEESGEINSLPFIPAKPHRKQRMKKKTQKQISSSEPALKEENIDSSTRCPPNPNNPCRQNRILCWYCDKEGHLAKFCPNKQGIACYKCKSMGVITSKCRRCNPPIATIEVREPSKEVQHPTLSSATSTAAVSIPLKTPSPVSKVSLSRSVRKPSRKPPCSTDLSVPNIVQPFRRENLVSRCVETALKNPHRCWNCGKKGHRYSNCHRPRKRRFCYRCGRTGFDVKTCPHCVSRPIDHLSSVSATPKQSRPSALRTPIHSPKSVSSSLPIAISSFSTCNSPPPVTVVPMATIFCENAIAA